MDEAASQGPIVTGDTVQVAFGEPGYPGPEPAQAAAAHRIDLIVVKLPEAKQGFGLLPKRWVVAPNGHPSFAWTARCRRLAPDDVPLSETLAGFHGLAFAILILKPAVLCFAQSSLHALR